MSTDQAVLNLIEEHRLISRAEISKRLGTSKPTISKVITRLCEKDFVFKQGFDRSSGGRKPLLYGFNAEKGYVIGMDIGATNARAAVANLYGEVLATVHEPTKKASVGALSQQLVGLCSDLQARITRPDRLLSVAVGTPGVVDPMSHTVHYAPNMPVLEDPSFFEHVEQVFNVPVAFHNDVNLAALGESSQGAGKSASSFAFVNIGSGLGLGLVYEGVLLLGHLGRAGEFGYTRMSPQDDHTIEDYLSGYGLSTLHLAAGGSGRPRDAFDEAARGAVPGVGVIETFLGYVAWLLAAIANLLDPELIVLGGSLGLRCEPYLARIGELIERQSPIVPQIVASELADKAGLAGAVAAALALGRPRLLEQLGGAS